MGTSSPNEHDRRLESWKEIAAFFGRDERTVRRWEAENALPVHRIPGAAKGRVFAYEGELREWLTRPQETTEPTASESGQRPERPEESRAGTPFSAGPRLGAKWSALLGLTAICLIVFVLYRGVRRHDVHASEVVPTTVTANPPGSPKPEAEDLYLKGRYYWNKRTPDDLQRAADDFTLAIAKDPGYSQAYTGLADTYSLMREYSIMPASEAYPRALAAARKGVELDDSSAEAHTSLAFVEFFWSWDAVAAERDFRRALELAPNDARTHHWYASFLQASGRSQEALEQIEEARRLEPSSVAILADKGQLLRSAGQTDAAVNLLKQVERADPSSVSAHRYLSEIYLDRMDCAEFLTEREQMARLLQAPHDLALVKTAREGFAKDGCPGMLEALLRSQRKLNALGLASNFDVAETCARLGRKKEALRYLRAAYEAHESTVLIVPVNHAFDNLHETADYKELLAKIQQGAPASAASHPAETSAQNR